MRLVEHERARRHRAKRLRARGEDVVVDDGYVCRWDLRPVAAQAGERLRAAPGQPALDLAHPVELQARRADDDRRVGVVGLQRRQRLDRLAQPLLVGQERPPLLQQIGDAGALKRLQLAAELRQRRRRCRPERRVGRRRERHEPRGAGVLLADLLQYNERLRLDPDVALGQEAVELLHAEGIGADRG